MHPSPFTFVIPTVPQSLLLPAISTLFPDLTPLRTPLPWIQCSRQLLLPRNRPRTRPPPSSAPVLHNSAPCIVFTDGSCRNNGAPHASAAAAVFWGDDSKNNWSARIPGPQTNNAAELFAILHALSQAPPDRTLHIFSDSEYSIRSVTYWSSLHYTIGWSCANGMLLENIWVLIRSRSAPVRFRWVKAHDKNRFNIIVDNMAFLASFLPSAPPFVPYPPHICSSPSPTSLPLPISKVSCDLPSLPLPRQRDQLIIVPNDDISLETHRGRSHARRQKWENLLKLLSCENDAHFWRLIRSLVDPKPRPALVSLEQLKTTFQARMNPPRPLPITFHASHHAALQRLSRSIPAITVDRTDDAFFSRPWDLQEIQLALKHIKSRNMDSALGPDKVSYELILSIPIESTALLLQTCVDQMSIPTDWTEATIAAILKRGKPPRDPSSYRLVGLQSCFLKLLTLLIDRRLRAWADATNLIPNSQNGFRPKYRTNNNSFVLRCAIDRAKADGKPLYVAFVDLSNAFPSTDHGALWWKLYSKGVAGPIFDWLRLLYSKISYRVRLDREFSDSFQSFIGILAGDPASPQLWNMFLADFAPPTHPADILLNSQPISHLEQADDIVLFSTSPIALQIKLTSLSGWCSFNFMLINYKKTYTIVFGLKTPRPSLSIDSHILSYVTEYVYVGVTFSSSTKNIFSQHYKVKAAKARAIANTTLGLESYVGVIPPMHARQLYMARIDPHLTFACEAVVDTDKRLVKTLEDVQHLFLRRLLGLNPRFMRAPLFSETAITPIAIRRIILSLRFFQYLLSLSPHHYARLALEDSVFLRHQLSPSWYGDLSIVLKRLSDLSGVPLTPPSLHSTPDDVSTLIKSVQVACEVSIQEALDKSPKLILLRDRLEKDENGKLVRKTMAFRHYLYVQVPEYRQSLTRLLLSDHTLAVEVLRRKTRYRPAVPHPWRLCRLCLQDVEDPIHALLVCSANRDLCVLRLQFLSATDAAVPSARTGVSTPEQLFRSLYSQRKTINLLAKFAHEVLRIFDSFAIFSPPAHVFHL